MASILPFIRVRPDFDDASHASGGATHRKTPPTSGPADRPNGTSPHAAGVVQGWADDGAGCRRCAERFPDLQARHIAAEVT
jgi:hypothetical protein